MSYQYITYYNKNQLELANSLAANKYGRNLNINANNKHCRGARKGRVMGVS